VTPPMANTGNQSQERFIAFLLERDLALLIASHLRSFDAQRSRHPGSSWINESMQGNARFGQEMLEGVPGRALNDGSRLACICSAETPDLLGRAS